MDRRSFFQTAGAAAGALALADAPLFTPQATAAEQVLRIAKLTVRNRETVLSTLDPWAPAAGEWNVHTIGHLYRRAGFGATMAEIKAAQALTPGAVVDALLDDKWTLDANMPAPPAHSDIWLGVSPIPKYNGDPQQEQIDYSYATSAIRRHWAAQMSQSNTMLREKMVYFWANHFVVEAQKVYYPQMMYDFLNYFRHHGWGNFKQMVKDVSAHPAMLIYLDGASSYRSNPNENYARELMELFTLGVVDQNGNPNYTEDDVKAMALSLTGYGFDASTLGATYTIGNHDYTYRKPAPFGAPIKSYGLSSNLQSFPDDIIYCLFQYKGDKLAYYICGKLYQYFVYHDITGDAEKAIISQLATTFQNSNWELKPVLAQLLKSAHFFDDANIGAAIKSPFEHMIGLTRHLDISVDDLMAGTLQTFSQALLNQSLLDPPNVKGWPGYRSWISTTTLPMRNLGLSYQLCFNGGNGGIAAQGATGYLKPDNTPEYHSPIKWQDASVLTWASQFADYKGDIVSFLSQVYAFLCPMPIIPDETKPIDQTDYLLNQLTFPDYEWPGMDDATRTGKIRAIVSMITSMPEYQLM